MLLFPPCHWHLTTNTKIGHYSYVVNFKKIKKIFHMAVSRSFVCHQWMKFICGHPFYPYMDYTHPFPSMIHPTFSIPYG